MYCSSCKRDDAPDVVGVCADCRRPEALAARIAALPDPIRGVFQRTADGYGLLPRPDYSRN